MTDEQILDARRAKSSDAKIDAALKFAEKVIKQKAKVSDGDVKALSSAGYSNGNIAEIVANVALHMFSNYFNIAMDTEVDFPEAPPLKRSARVGPGISLK